MLPPSRPAAPLILLASVLKPTDDTRMYEKFGGTLAEAGYRVHVAGRAAAQAPAAGSIAQHPIFGAQRLSLARLAAQWRYWRLLSAAPSQPDLVVVHAPELLPLTLLWHRLTGRPFLYDVRENYALNIRTQQVYRGLLRRVLAAGVTWMERRAAQRAAAVLLAERSYARELPWLPPERTVVLENKYVAPAGTPAPPTPVRLPNYPAPLRLLYSGTISELNGVFDAIDLAARLQRQRGNVVLTVVGYCQRPDEQRRLAELAAAHPEWLRVVGGAQPVPHAAILAEIRRSHLGLLPYRPHPSSWQCIPTKLYEYFANALPVLVPLNPLWQAEVERHEAGAAVDFRLTGPTLETVVRMLSPRQHPRGFYPHGPPAEALWQSEAPRLLAAVRAALPPAPRPETARPGPTF